MGNTDTKLSYRQAVINLTSRSQPIEPDDEFWSQFWHENHIDSIGDVFALLTAQEIRQLRDESPSNLSTLCYKAVEQLVRVTDTLCNTASQHRTVLTCSALLTRILPYLFEDSDWRQFFWTQFPLAESTSVDENNSTLSSSYHPYNRPLKSDIPGCEILNKQIPLSHSLLLAIADLMFCPDFTVAPLDSKGNRFGAPDTPPEDLQSIDSCEYIWEAGVGCSIGSPTSATYDNHRTQLLRLLLTCFSESIYCSAAHVGHQPNRWIQFFTSVENRHALPLFTSLLNTVFAYNPNSFLPFNHLLFQDSKEPLVEVALQILIVILDHDFSTPILSSIEEAKKSPVSSQDNLFINYISRIHREDDFEFILKGFTKLLNNPLQQSYLPNSTKKIKFHQELLVLFWKICDYNKKFMYYVLKTCDVLKILVPILYHLNDARADRSRVGLVHIGVFIILLLSGERNFGVRLNRPYQAVAPMDLPIFSGTHADLLVIVFHKLITTGHQRLQPLFDCLLTILVNVSPYLKTLSMVASAKILHLLEAFSTPWFLFSNPTNHHLVFFLLEIFNNIIQYQFDGNSNLIYTIIRKRQVFHALSNLPTDYGIIQRSLNQAKLQALISTNHTSGQMKRFNRQHSSQSKSSTAQSSIIDYDVTASHSNPSTPTECNNENKISSLVHKSESTSTNHKITSAPVDMNILTNEPSNSPIPSLISTSTNHMNISLAALPKLEKMTERTHPNHKIDSEDSVGDKFIQNNPEDIVNTNHHHCQEHLSANRTNSRRPKSMSRQSSTASDDQSSAGSSSKGSKDQKNIALDTGSWHPSTDWIISWKQKLPLQTIMRMLQVLVPQVEKMCLDKGITDENEILKFLQHGTLVGLLPVPHPILIRKYQTNIGTTIWFRTYMWGIIYLRNSDPPIWYDTEVRLFEIQKS
ncbi:hid-1-like protein [Dermatophagoides farinae]|uniref:Hid-1-like protein n=1 Tax=Dermatophagoides farinae TaxID=6954 RepID=A0A9D4P851_DERFA|nr:hid-1-like protein [Dermatophagoides farinae]